MMNRARRRHPFYILIFHSLLSLLPSVHSIGGGGCKTTFAKVAGFAPSLPKPAPPLYSSTYGHAITAECYNKCKSDSDCEAFILDYAKATCYKVDTNQTYRRDYLRKRDSQLMPDPSVSYFIKICIPVDNLCANRAWVTELTPGYELLSTHHTVLPNIHSWSECSERCIMSGSCKSANFFEYSDTCSLSDIDSWDDPQALAPTIRTSTDYIDNQCLPDDGKFCWHDPILNHSSIRADLSYDNATPDECAQRCQTNAYFKCRGYSYVYPTALSKPQCHLHSDAVLNPAGPLLAPTLTPHTGASYYERIRCTNVSVTCDSKQMVVNLVSSKFKGQLYVEGHSERCSVTGDGRNTTTLVIPLANNNPCDVQHAFALSRTTNKTMLSTIVVVQYHRQIQTLGDAVVRVTCYLGSGGGGGGGGGGSNNISVATSVSVNTQAPQTQVTGSGNGTEAPPVGHLSARMQIIDPRTNKEVTKAIHIGDPLQLQIIIDPPYNVSYVRAGHLVAKSGPSTDETLLLLNWEGCPPDPKIFPGLTPASPNMLIGDFKAFRFPSSPVLMLSVYLTLCPNGCPKTDCGNGVQSYGRRKRDIVNKNQLEEIPLQVLLVVNERTDDQTPPANPLIVDPNALESGEVCLSFVALSLMALVFLLVQGIILAIVCWYLGKREKEAADTISLRRDFNQPQPMSHHVTWADQVDTGRQQGVSYI